MTGQSLMVRLNFLLAIVLIVSGLYLVKISYESRRLFAEIENAHSNERQLESDRRRLEAERQAQATHLRVESTARTKLSMRAATPANTQYVVDAGLAAAPMTAPLTAPSRMPAAPASAPDSGASQ
jgi:cell division protein FtsL